MNREDIIRMARQSGMAGFDGVVHAMFQLEAFAALVASAEREACAYKAGIALLGADRGLANRVDQAIRARGQ
jgi:hypothetical protein